MSEPIQSPRCSSTRLDAYGDNRSLSALTRHAAYGTKSGAHDNRVWFDLSLKSEWTVGMNAMCRYNFAW